MKNKGLTRIELFLIFIGLAFISASIGAYFLLWNNMLILLAIFLVIGAMFFAIISAIALICVFLYKSERPRFHWIFLLAIPFLIFNLIGALSPITDADGAGYHLAMIKIYQQAHHFVYHPNVVSNWPMSAEMVYGAMLHFGLPPKLLHYLFGILLAVLAYVIAKREFGEEVAAWAAVIIYTIPMVVLESGIAYVDLFFASFIVAGLYLAYKYTEIKDNKILLLSSIFLGFGASIKWTGPLFVVLAFIFLLIRALFKNKREVIKAIVYPIPGVFFFSLWLVKNWILSGNPFIPFMHGKNWTDPNIVAYIHTIHQSGANLIDFILTTWNLQFNGLALGELTWLGPIFAAFLPLLLLKKNKPKSMKVGLWFSAIFYSIWYLTSPQSRLLLPIFIILAIFIAYVIQTNRLFKAAVVIAILSALPFAADYNGQSLFIDDYIMHPAPPCAAEGLHCDFITSKIPAYPIYEYVNKHLPNASVMIYGDIHTYYLDANYVWARPDMQGWINNYSYLGRYGITHVVINEEFSDFPDIKEQIMQNNLKFIEKFEGVSLWEVSKQDVIVTANPTNDFSTRTWNYSVNVSLISDYNVTPKLVNCTPCDNISLVLCCVDAIE